MLPCLIMHAKPLLVDFMKGDRDRRHWQQPLLLQAKEMALTTSQLIDVNEIIRFHPVEFIGYDLRESMTAMKKIV